MEQDIQHLPVMRVVDDFQHDGFMCPAQLGDRIVHTLFDDPLDQRIHRNPYPQAHGLKQVFLILEMPVDRATGHTRSFRNLV